MKAGHSFLTTREEVRAKEELEARQSMLNESWSKYATRIGVTGSVLRVKNVTESWATFEARKKKQKVFFDLQVRVVAGEAARDTAAKQSLRAQSNAVIEKLMAYDRLRLDKQTPQQHHLFVDFCDYQRQVFSQQRALLGEQECMLRAKISEAESELLYSIVYMWHADSHLQYVGRRERIREEHAKERQRDLTEQHNAEAKRQLEAERLARELQIAEDEKERVEQEKRLERKRREEERRVKARMEREQRVSRDVQPES